MAHSLLHPQGSCVNKLSIIGKLDDSKATKQIVALLSAPLNKYNNVITALKLSNYPRVMEYLDNETNKVMAKIIIQSIMKNETYISTGDKVYLYIFIWHSLYLLWYCPSNFLGFLLFRSKHCLN